MIAEASLCPLVAAFSSPVLDFTHDPPTIEPRHRVMPMPFPHLEEALRHSEEFAARLIESSHDCINTSPAGRVGIGRMIKGTSGTRAFRSRLRLRLKKDDVASGEGNHIEEAQPLTIIPLGLSLDLSLQPVHPPHRRSLPDCHASGGH